MFWATKTKTLRMHWDRRQEVVPPSLCFTPSCPSQVLPHCSLMSPLASLLCVVWLYLQPFFKFSCVSLATSCWFIEFGFTSLTVCSSPSLWFLYIEAMNWLTHWLWLFKHVNTCLSLCRKRNIMAYLISLKTKLWWLVLFCVLCHNLYNSIISVLSLCVLSWAGCLEGKLEVFLFFSFCLSLMDSAKISRSRVGQSCCWTEWQCGS